MSLTAPIFLVDRRVRAAAEVGERAVRVERDALDGRAVLAVRDEIVDQLDLVVLPLGEEAGAGIGDRQLFAVELLRGLHVLLHLGLDGREVGLGDRDALRELEVVVEAVLDRRADRDLHAGIEIHHGGGEDVGSVVADEIAARPVRSAP